MPPSFSDMIAGIDGTPHSLGPATSRGRTVQAQNLHSVLGDIGSQARSRRDRRSSAFSQQSQRSHFSPQPPPPHLPQAHFYGAPQPNFGFVHDAEPTKVPGDDGYYCGFDVLSAAGANGTLESQNVILIGWEGGLDVFSLCKDHLESIGRLTGLRGGVVDARIIPAAFLEDGSSSVGPLVAVIIHGPVLPASNQPALDHAMDEIEGETTVHSLVDMDIQIAESPYGDNEDAVMDDISQYQTSVEIYSLSTFTHVSTLLVSKAVDIALAINSPLFTRPPPIGRLSVQISGKYIVVSSGDSGEVFVFEVKRRKRSDSGIPTFECVGKTWTSIARASRSKRSRSSSASDASAFNETSLLDLQQDGRPILSLGGRWLAISPPDPSRRTFSVGDPVAISTSNVPGLTASRASSRPPVNCEAQTPDGYNILDTISRIATQQVIKGASWIGTQAWQRYDNYMNPSAPGAPHPRAPEHGRHVASNPQFPPTNAYLDGLEEEQNVPNLVCIIDLEKISDSPQSTMGLNPLVTFQAPLGCSFLSFSPGGLWLLTASAKGDVQYVWDLMRMSSGHPPGIGPAQDSHQMTSHVRQVAKFTRKTEARIIDVVWPAPTGERLALVTDKGTVHVFEFPPIAFQWPPPRQANKIAKRPAGSAGSDENLTGTLGAALGLFNAAYKTVSNTTQPYIEAAQRAGGIAMTAPRGRPASRTMRAGLSKSFDAVAGTVDDLRNTGENRIHIPTSSNPIRPGCVRWLTGDESGFIAVVAGGNLRMHAVGHRYARKGNKQHVKLAGNVFSFALAKLPDDVVAPNVVEQMGLEIQPSVRKSWYKGFWSLRPGPESDVEDPQHPLSFAEIETNAPYQPFHTDRRINMFTFEDEASLHVSDASPWIFGQPIPGRQVNVGVQEPEHEDATFGDSFLHSQASRKTAVLGEADVFEQIVVTTRRRSKREGAEGDEDDEEGFFEEDCEVLDFAHDRV